MGKYLQITVKTKGSVGYKQFYGLINFIEGHTIYDIPRLDEPTSSFKLVIDTYNLSDQEITDNYEGIGKDLKDLVDIDYTIQT